MATEKTTIILDVQVTQTEAQKSLDQLNKQLFLQREELKKLNKSYKEGKITADQYADEQIRLKKEIQDTGREQRQQQKIVRDAIKETKAAEGSNEELRLTLARLTREYNKLGKEQRESTKEGRSLQKQIKNLSDELKDNEKAIGDNRRNVGNYAEAFDGLTGSIGGSISQFVGPGGLIALGGLLVEGMVEGAKAVIEITKEFTRLRGETQRLTGETGPALDELVVKIKAISDTFDQEFNEVLLAANTLSKQLGISQAEAAELIEQGFLAGANASGELLDILKEYPSQLQSIGLNAEQSVAAITQQVQEGIFSDKGIDALKEAGLRLRELPKATEEALAGIGLSSEEIQKSLEDGSKTLFDVIQEVSAQLGELPANSKEVGTAIADIFGGPGEDAGLKYLLTLQNIELELDNLVDQTNSLTQIQQEQLELNQDLATAQNELSKTFEGTGEGLDLLITQGKIFAIETLISIIDNIKAVIEIFEFFIDTIKFFGETAGNIFGFVFDLFNDLREFLGFSRVEFGDFGETIKQVGEIIKSVFSFGFRDLVNAAKAGFEALTNTVTDLINEAKELSNTFLGTEFEIKVRTDEATEGVNNLALSVENLEKVVGDLALPEPVPPDFSRFKKEADDLREDEEEKTKKSSKNRAQIALKERVAGIELELLAVEKGGERELELQKQLIDAKKDLAIQGTKDQINATLLLQEQALQQQLELQRQFASNVQEIDTSSIQEELNNQLTLTLAETEAQQNRLVTTQEVNDQIIQEQNQLAQAIVSIQDFIGSETEQNILAGAELLFSVNQQQIELTQQRLENAEEGSAEFNQLQEKLARQQKRRAIGEALVNTYQGATRAIASLPPPFSFIAAGAQIVFGLAQVANIKAQSFAKGGFTGNTGVNDPDVKGRKIVGYVHDNEYVMPTKVLKTPQGAAIASQAEGIRKGLPGFQDGGFTSFNTGNLTTLQNTQNLAQDVNISNEIKTAFEDIDLFVSWQEFNTLDQRVKAKEGNSGI